MLPGPRYRDGLSRSEPELRNNSPHVIRKILVFACQLLIRARGWQAEAPAPPPPAQQDRPKRSPPQPPCNSQDPSFRLPTLDPSPRLAGGSACPTSAGKARQTTKCDGLSHERQWRSPMTPDPRILYTERLAERRAGIAHHQQRHRRLGHAKLGMAASGVALVWLALSRGAFSILWVLAPIAGFVALVVIHEKLLKELERRKRAARFFRSEEHTSELQS